MLTDEDMKNIAYWVASKPAKAGFAKDKDLVPWASASTAAALQTATSPPALAATAPTAPAFLPNTRACRASMLTTPWRS
jgi:hypothetical protein